MRKELPKFFEQILNITEPWYIAKIEQQGNTNNIYVDFKKGAKFEYNGKYYSAYDMVQRSHVSIFYFFIAEDKTNLTLVLLLIIFVRETSISFKSQKI
jgi:hypothetical protein